MGADNDTNLFFFLLCGGKTNTYMCAWTVVLMEKNAKIASVLMISDIVHSQVLYLWDPAHGIDPDGSHNLYIMKVWFPI